MDIDKICINCMEDSLQGGKCPSCGYVEGTYHSKIHHLEPYTILNKRYLLGRALGEGGFGITYLTYDLAKGERVAIKEFFVAGLLVREKGKTVLVDESVGTKAFYEECKAKFAQEARTLRKLNDKNGIVGIYDDFGENNTQYIVMEYLDGVPLSVFLKSRGGKITLEETFEILSPAMKSLIELHNNSIYHRDISPDNIQYMRSGLVKIVDLGGSKDMLDREVRSHIVAVKHGYAPPEQYITGYKIGPWMDVYAMAATIYRCITGIVPPQSTAREDGEDPLQKPSALGIAISPAAEGVLLKGMALQADDRYMNMYDFYYALKHALKNDTSPLAPKDPEGYDVLISELNTENHYFNRDIVVSVLVYVVIIILLVRRFF